RLRREARALARLTHPNIVQAFDVGEHDGRQFIVMEYVEGRSLESELRDKGHVSPTLAASYAYQAALALAHAHEHGLVHRDVKPSNLLLTPAGQVKLLDLGLARFLQDQVGSGTLTREHVGMGTPDYAAPEQFRDAHTADARSDIYALGCTLYHVIAGRVPFPGSSLSEKVAAHEHHDPQPLEELCPDVPAGLAQAVRRMMAKGPAERFQSAIETADALVPYASDPLPMVRAQSPTVSWDGRRSATAKSPRRSRVPWLITGGVVAALAGVLITAFALGWFDARMPEGGLKPKTDALPSQREADVLTVSKEPEGGGEYRRVQDALRVVRSGQTIRVLDQG